MVKFAVVVEGRPFEVEIMDDGSVRVDGSLHIVDLSEANGQPSHSLLLDGRSYETQLRDVADGHLQVVVDGRPYRAKLTAGAGCIESVASQPGTDECTDTEAQAWVKVPLPGILVETRVSNGDQVQEGDVVAVLESMKMHLELRAPRAGVVSALDASAGQEVDLDEVLATIA